MPPRQSLICLKPVDNLKPLVIHEQTKGRGLLDVPDGYGGKNRFAVLTSGHSQLSRWGLHMVMSHSGDDPRDNDSTTRMKITNNSIGRFKIAEVLLRKGRHSGSNFRRALDRADLTEADFTNSDFEEHLCYWLMKSAFDEADFRGADLKSPMQPFKLEIAN